MQAVAAEARVSLGTVSNYLNQPSRVAPATRDRVQAAIDRLGYIRNAAARDLKRRGSDGIGLIVPDILNRLFVDIARGAQITAGHQNLSLLMANAVYAFESFSPRVTSDQQDQFLDYFAEERMRGILYAAMSDPTAGINRIRAHVRPIVVINYDRPGDWCSVLVDNQQAGRLGGEHLAEAGFRTVYFLSPPNVAQAISDRRAGARDAARRLELQLIEWKVDGLWLDDGRRAIEEIVARTSTNERFAVLGVTDELALGALGALRMHPQLRVPEDVAVMGLDGTHDGKFSDWISLTSVTVPGNRMGEEAIRLVLDEAEPRHRHERMVLPVGVRRGGSTGAAETTILAYPRHSVQNGSSPLVP
ncbi:LacI family DNA-binding transcriptional regulator [Leifsonia sp. McL0607]|uniref:LacI family DNA-binding transcriptional regulator n=1 Tax=Leifsonia sp. McL0607 TaxID=3415672 RepID=UPI003CFB86D0